MSLSESSRKEGIQLLEKMMTKDVSETAGYILIQMFFRNSHGVISFVKMRRDGITQLTRQDIEEVHKVIEKNGSREFWIHEDEHGMSLGFGWFKKTAYDENRTERQFAYYVRREEKNKSENLLEHLLDEVQELIGSDELQNFAVKIPREVLNQNIIEIPAE